MVAGRDRARRPRGRTEDASELFEGLTEGGGLVALVRLGRRRDRDARARRALALRAGALHGGGRGGGDRRRVGPRTEPTFLPGLTVEEAAADDSTIVVLLVGLAVGALILVPSLFVLFRLVLTGRFDLGAQLGRADEGEAEHAAGAKRVLVPAAVGVVAALVLIVAEVSWLQLCAAAAMLVAVGVVLPALALRAEAHRPDATSTWAPIPCHLATGSQSGGLCSIAPGG